MQPHTKAANLDDPLLDTLESTKEIGCSKSLLEKLRVTGGGPEFIKIGALVRYRRSAIHAWLDERTHRSTTGARRQSARRRSADHDLPER